MRRIGWGCALGAALLGAASCSQGDGPPDAVCDLLGQPLREVSGLPFVGDEQTVAQLLERTAEEAREETFSVVKYLEPGVPDADVDAVFDVVDDAVDSEVVLVSAADAFVEYQALFAESQPEFVELVEASALPASVRFETDSVRVLEEVVDEVSESPSVYEVIDSRDFANTSVRALAIYAPDLLDDLAEVEGDQEVVEAAQLVADIWGPDDPEVGQEATDAALLLADRAEACGLLE